VTPRDGGSLSVEGVEERVAIDDTKIIAISFKTLAIGSCWVAWVVDIGVSYTSSLGDNS